MCDLRSNWDSFMSEGERHIDGSRECLEPDDGDEGESCIDESREYSEPDDEDEGDTQGAEVNLNGAVNLDGVLVSPFLSDSGINIGNAVYLDTWFDGLNLNRFNNFWTKYEKQIKQLVRYPGGYHEWLMVSTLPELKAMGIPMCLIRQMIVPTSDCSFYVNGIECRHGRSGSGTMHRDLFKAIVMTYYEDLAFDGKDYVYNGTVYYADKLRANLTAFFIVYYPEGTYFPEEVREFLGIEGYAGE